MSNFLKYIIWAGLYAVLVIPFIVADSLFFPYITGKAFAFRIIVEVIFGLWLILCLKEKEFWPRRSWLLGSVGALVVVLLLADINAVAPFKAFWSNYERMEGFVTFVHLLAYFVVLGSMFNREKLWLWFLRANLLAGTIMAISSIAASLKEDVIRFAGPLGNPIYISVYFLFIFFFTLILWYKDVGEKNLTDWRAFKKVLLSGLSYLYLGVALLSLFVVYRTSRGALLGLVGGVFIGAILIALLEKQRKVLKHLAQGGVVAVIVVLLIFLSVRETAYVKNDPTLSRLAEISWSNVNGQARQLIWPMALKGFKEKPLLGWGQEGFNYVFNKYYDPGMYGQEAWFDRAHNAPLDFLVAGGILGFLSYLCLFVSALYLLWFKKNPLNIAERSLLTGLLAGYLFQAIFVFDNLVSYILFFTVLAYIHSNQGSRQGLSLSDGKKGQSLSTFIQNEEYQNYILIPGVVVLTVVSLYFVNVPALRANQTLMQALNLIRSGQVTEGTVAFETALAYKSLGTAEIREQLISYTPSIIKTTGLDPKIKQAFFALTVEEVKKQIARVPTDARYYILLGSLLTAVGRSDLALDYITKAVELSPQKQAMRFELIQALYSLGRKADALAEAKKAYELDVRYDQAKSLYETLLKEKPGK